MRSGKHEEERERAWRREAEDEAKAPTKRPRWFAGPTGTNSSDRNEAASGGEPRRPQRWWKSQTSLKRRSLLHEVVEFEVLEEM